MSQAGLGKILGNGWRLGDTAVLRENTKKHRCYAVPFTQINSNSMATYSVSGELPVVKDQAYACPLATTVAV
jgi:hypothetical protein